MTLILDPNIFFDDWNHQYHLEIIVVYHNVQNEEKLTSLSRENEFGECVLVRVCLLLYVCVSGCVCMCLCDGRVSLSVCVCLCVCVCVWVRMCDGGVSVSEFVNNEVDSVLLWHYFPEVETNMVRRSNCFNSSTLGIKWPSCDCFSVRRMSSTTFLLPKTILERLSSDQNRLTEISPCWI